MTFNRLHLSSNLLVLCGLLFFMHDLSAAQREGGGNAKIVSKLQTMVNTITAERDTLQADNLKLTTELDSLKAKVKETEDNSKSQEEKFIADLASQKSSHDELQVRMDNTSVRLKEVIDKYNALNRSKNDLTIQQGNLENLHKVTVAELKSCEIKNMKMFEGAKQVIAGYNSCQTKDIFDSIIDAEPFSQIKNVEFEAIIQEYEDKLHKQKYHVNSNAKLIPQASTHTVGADIPQHKPSH
jgi:hypothetical protein